MEISAYFHVLFDPYPEKFMPKLIVISGAMKNRAFQVTGEKVSVGRLSDNLIRLEDVSISGHHAELTRNGDRYILKDLFSTNGTTLNGKKISQIAVEHNNVIQFGQVQFLFLDPGANSQKPPSPKDSIDSNNPYGSQSAERNKSAALLKKRPFRIWMAFQLAIIIVGGIATTIIFIRILQMLNL